MKKYLTKSDSLYSTNIKEFAQPKYIGAWSFSDGDIKIETTKKPSLWCRFWFSVFFNTKWFKYNENKKH